MSLGLLGTRGSKQDSSLAQGDSELLGSGSYESLETREAQLGISKQPVILDDTTFILRFLSYNNEASR